MSNSEHWQRIYSSHGAQRVGWYAPHLATSLEWIAALKLPPEEPIIDIGGGASTLAEDLLGLGHKDLHVLDLSERAMALARERLGSTANSISWLQGDVTEVDLPWRHFAVWHDRAAFHFLIEPEQKRLYLEKICGALKTGGHLIIGTFGTEAPAKCSGLPVQRYTAESLASTLGAPFKLIRHQYEMHRTPAALAQAYVYCLFQKTTEPC